MSDTLLQQLSKTDRNPVQETQYQDLLKSQGATGSSSGLDTTSLISSASQLNDFYKQQNQPVIAATEATKAPLKQRYDDLLASIKGNQQIAENRQTVTTNNELGKRGLTGSSGVAQQELTNAVNPITQQYTGMLKDTTGQENIDMAAIDKVIAQLNAGNPDSSLTAASGLQARQQASSQFEQNLQLQKYQQAAQAKQQDIANAIAQLQAQAKGGYQTVGEGASIYDPVTGQIVSTAPKQFKASGGGSDSSDPFHLNKTG